MDNYGTGMMGIVAISRIAALIKGPLRFDCDFADEVDIAEVRSELGLVPGTAESDRIEIIRTDKASRHDRNSRKSLLQRAIETLTKPSKTADRDLIVVLGGDFISEHYSKRIWLFMASAWRWSFDAPVIFLGHTMGPFDQPRNRLAARTLLRSSHIFSRDRWCTDYLRREFGLDRRLYQSTDLAYATLPLQRQPGLVDELMARYGLTPDGYATMVISGLQKRYTPDPDLYFGRHAEIVSSVLALPEMAGRKLCLLAHTFGASFGHEPDLVATLLDRLPSEVRKRVVPVTDRILPTRARLILGNGLFTITGRMHPAVSTFQMGKPAITLAYSTKYEGVIGTMLGRSDLIIAANYPGLWQSGKIVDLAVERARLVLETHPKLTADIRTAIDEQQTILDTTFAQIERILKGEHRVG
jgi:colanic acid/amylovoran biosynthesis protein